MREKLYKIITVSEGGTLGRIYDHVMIILIIVSLIPLAFKERAHWMEVTDSFVASFFILDYFFRLITADYYYDKHNWASFVRYPFSLMAIIDMVAIMPSITTIHSGFLLLRLVRMIPALRVVRLFKLIRYSKNISMVVDVLKRTKDSLYAVCIFAAGYILTSALLIFNVEPNSFDNFFEAVYWATISLVTVGYGDVYAVSTVGRIVTMVSAVFGVAVVALPAGIITAGYMKTLEERKAEKNEE